MANTSEDDAYDLDYYERTGGKIEENLLQEIRDARREIRNNKLNANNKFKCSLLAIICLLVLNVTILTQNSINLHDTTGNEAESSRSLPSEGTGALDK